MNSKKKIIIFDNINILIILFIILFKKKKIYYYFSNSVNIEIFKKFLNFKKIDLVKIYSDEANIFKNKNLYYITEYFKKKLVNQIFSTINISRLPYKSNLFKNILKSWVSDNITAQVEKLFLSKNFVSKKYKNAKIIIYFSKCIFFKEMKLFSKKEFENLDMVNINFFPKKMFVILLKPYLDCFLSLFLGTKKAKNTERSNILVQFEKNIFNYFPSYGHFFWFEKSKIPKKNILFYVNRKEINVDNKLRKQFKQKNFKFINCNPTWHIRKSLNEMMFLLFNFLKNLMILNFKINSLSIYCAFYVIHYKNIIRLNNIRVVHQNFECQFDPLALSYACKTENIFFIWNTWSFSQYFKTDFSYGFSDIFFSWGKYQTDFLKSQGYKFGKIFETGIISGDNFNLKNFHNSNRKELIIFDGFYNENDLHHSKAKMFQFFNSLFKISLKYNIPCVVKPISKKSFSDFEFSNKEKIRILKKKKLIKILDSRIKPSQIISKKGIILAYNISTAGLLSMLKKNKVFFYDLNCLTINPLYKFKNFKNLVITDHSELESIINKMLLKNKKYEINKKILNYLNNIDFNLKAQEKSGSIFYFLQKFYKSKCNTVRNKSLALKELNYFIKENKIKQKISERNYWKLLNKDISRFYSDFKNYEI